MKKAIAYSLMAVGIAAFVIAIRFYQLETLWLDRLGLKQFAQWMLCALGLGALIAPMGVLTQLSSLTKSGCLKTYSKVMGITLGVAFAIGMVVHGVKLLFWIPVLFEQPWLGWLWLVIFVPAIPAGIDLYQGTYERTWEKFQLAHALYFTKALGLILIQFICVGGMVAIIAGCIYQIIGGLDLVFRFGDRLLLCTWTSAPQWFCLPGQFLFHVFHFVATVIVVIYGDWIFNKLTDGYLALLMYLTKRLDS